MRKNTALIQYTVIACLAFFLFTNASAATTLAEADQSAAVILAYNRIGDDFNTENNLQTTLFEAQIKTLRAGPYNILGLNEILDLQKNHKPLPQKAVAITFEGGYKSALKNAIPILLKYKIPFTVFYAADRADANTAEFMNWNDLQLLKQSQLVSFGILTSSYNRLIEKSKLDIQTQLNKSKTKHRDFFKAEPKLFSYPFGEYNTKIKNLVKNQGYRAAFSLNSGIYSTTSDNFSIPRFTITDEFGDTDHFNLIINALPLPVTELEPNNPALATASPNIGFTLNNELAENAKDLRCFTSSQDKPSIEFAGKTRVEIRLKSPIDTYRTRINCIMPVKTSDGDEENIKNWRWLGLLLIYPQAVDK